MKKYLVLLTVICGASAAFAADYNLVNDWVFDGPNNPNGAWGYGSMIQNTNGVFSPFAAATIHDTTSSSAWDRWVVANTSDTCVVWDMPGGLWTFPANSVVLNAWNNYASVVHWAGDAGTYNLSAAFQTGGYATPTPTYPDTTVYVIKNDTTVLFQQEIFGFAGANMAQQITMAPGDWLDFVVAGNPEARASLDANLAAVPEPASLGLLALGGLLFLFRRRR